MNSTKLAANSTSVQDHNPTHMHRSTQKKKYNPSTKYHIPTKLQRGTTQLYSKYKNENAQLAKGEERAKIFEI